MSVCKRLRDYLDAHHVRYVVVTHSQAFTAQEIAHRMHVPGRDLAKTVVALTPRGLALAVVRAIDKVDMDAVGAALGRHARLASEQEFKNAFLDCEMGAMPPFGNLYGIPTLVDEGLTVDEEIVFNAGTHTEAIRMPYRDFAGLVRPRVAHLTLEPALH